MDIRIELNDTEVRRGLQRLIAAGADLSPAMRVIATHLADRAEDAFEQETSPTGQPWPPLKPATVKERTRKGYTPIKRLQRTGTLVRSILADWDNRTAVAGTNLIYAAPHQFGSDKRNIPARPFLGISTHDERVIQDIIARFIAERWR